MAEIRHKVLHALGWLLGARLVTQFFLWAITLYVMRLLSPEDYGVMALAMTFIAILGPLSELGLGSALVQHEQLDEKVISNTFGLVLTASWGLCALLAFSASYIGQFFDHAELEPVIQVLSGGLAISVLGIVPRALLTRSIDFRGQSIIGVGTAALSGVTGLVLAMNGYGVWALVWSTVVQNVFTAAGLIMLTRFRVLPSFDFRGITNVVSFGSWLTLERLTWMIFARADTFIIGKMLGTQALGYYSVATELAQLPQNKVQSILNTVAFPAYSRVRHESGHAEYYLLKYLRLASLVSVPVFLGISAVAPQFVETILTSKWAGAVFPIQILTLALPLRMIEAAIPPYLHALGLAKVSFVNVMIALIIIVVAILVGSNWGIDGVSVAWTAGYLLVFLVVILRTSRFTPLRVSQVLACLWRPLGAGTLMYLTVQALRIGAEPTLDHLSLLALLVITGVVTYALAAYWLCRAELRELQALFSRRVRTQ